MIFLLACLANDVDEDGDGVTAALDCDDTNASMHPNAGEVCDGVDNDCDGYIDEVGDLSEPLVYFPDLDGDGLGNSDRAGLGCEVPEGFSAVGGDCDDDDATVGAGQDWTLDLDGDGYAGQVAITACEAPSGGEEQGGDCNDGDPSAFPGAPESCDGVDDDCDGVIDEEADDATVFWADNDGDTWGGDEVLACRAGEGIASRPGDCDDDDAGISPQAEETCDGEDQDCDGSVDNDATDASTWYADLDLDGYGGVITQQACEAPGEHWLADGGADCNDGDPATNPDASEYCDHRDNDCDGTTDEDDALDALTWYADTDADGYGDPDSTTEACEEPSAYVADNTDCDDGDLSSNPGATEICEDGADNDCDGTANQCIPASGDTEDAAVTLNAENQDDRMGYDVALVDLDGDGYQDVISGAPFYSSGDPGRVYVSYGAATLSSSLSTYFYGPTNSYAGFALDRAGDVDGDGTDDLIIGAYASTESASRVYVVLGSTAGHSGGNALTSEIAFSGGAKLGYSVAGGGDVDGDGYDDLLMGSRTTDSSGAVYLVYGSSSLTGGSVSSETVVTSSQSSALFGYIGTLAMVGDLDGDGYDEAALGAYRYEVSDNEGAVGVIYGSASGWSSGSFPSGVDAYVTADEETAYLHRTAPVGDLDDDGYDDLAMGAPFANSYRGEVYLFYGSATQMSGSYDSGDADSEWRGEMESDYLGRSLSGGDVDGDGRSDLLLGANGNDDGGSSAGSTYVVLGGAYAGSHRIEDSAVATWVGGGSNYNSGWALAAGDANGDGYADVLTGAYNAPSSSGSPTYGAAYLFLGTGL